MSARKQRWVHVATAPDQLSAEMWVELLRGQGIPAMFTAQVFDGGRVKVGMNHPQGTDNARFLLNIIHWLSKME